MLRSSRMKYANDLPIYAAFDAGAVAYPGTLVADVPARLNALMREGDLDMGPVSAFEYAVDARALSCCCPICASARATKSSRCCSSRSTPPALLGGAKIAMTNESASGRNLLRILLERRYGVQAEFVEDGRSARTRARPASRRWLSAMARSMPRSNVPREYVYDLGALWRDWTGEQSVSAVWAARREIFEKRLDEVRACLHALTDAYSWGAREPRERHRAARSRSVLDLRAFTKSTTGNSISRFTSAAQRGLAAYCRELQAIGAIDRIPPFVPEVIGVAR